MEIGNIVRVNSLENHDVRFRGTCKVVHVCRSELAGYRLTIDVFLSLALASRREDRRMEACGLLGPTPDFRLRLSPQHAAMRWEYLIP